ncbi:MAG TPA: hypothetical protein PKV67_09400 [Hyphomonas sp.]|nr:hypothetical protein [Hyphomonas sp.]HRJ00983.1 hypothetical protein [Hyphomonas sp.]HRK68095.1 hypothetical protein [Hyphomonas sp.]
MKNRLPAAIALGFALSQIAAPLAMAQAPASQFRSVPAQTFSDSELARYGLTEAETAEVRAYEEQGYHVQVLTPEEAEAYNAGLSNNNILALIGLVAIVVVIASVV